jgi:adenylate cyclase class IV
MPRNVEIKARLHDAPAAAAPFPPAGSLAALLQRAALIADGPPERITQDDTFFACRSGRLKLRVFADGRGELIAYRRPDAAGPKTSDYRITPVADPASLRETLAHALGHAGRVVKERSLFRIGRTRLHLDRVESLGDFAELEVVLADAESQADGIAEAQALLARLQIDAAQLVEGAYVDLLAQTRPTPEPPDASRSMPAPPAR